MRLEVKSAANFLTNLLRIKSDPATFRNNVQQLELFCATLEDMLCLHYQQHWFPEKPFKGSGYRCIRINHKMDPIISKAGSESGFDEERLRQLFPDELTLWIDPREVSYRIGENGSICVLFDGAKCQFSSETSKVSPRTVTITVSRNENFSNSSNNNHHSHLEASPQSPHHYDRHLTSCKESIRNSSSWDSFIMDPRSMNLEQYTPYVSS